MLIYEELITYLYNNNIYIISQKFFFLYGLNHQKQTIIFSKFGKNFCKTLKFTFGLFGFKQKFFEKKWKKNEKKRKKSKKNQKKTQFYFLKTYKKKLRRLSLCLMKQCVPYSTSNM